MDENLFWQTRGLTQSREDHLTYFIAAALNCDAAFRDAYASAFLVAAGNAEIETVETQAVYEDEACRPDMRLRLRGGKVMLVEHKLDAAETTQVSDEGNVRGQLERYLELPSDGVLYFRSSLAPLPDAVLSHPRYIKPPKAPHFVWSDLYAALEKGNHILAKWLAEAFRAMGFTPALPHVGVLIGDSEAVIENQRNFGKLWRSTLDAAYVHWQRGASGHGPRGAQLYFTPKFDSPYAAVMIGPAAAPGTLLQVRVHTSTAELAQHAQLVLTLAAQRAGQHADFKIGRIPNGFYCDMLFPLGDALGPVADSAFQERSLSAAVIPLLDALRTSARPE